MAGKSKPKNKTIFLDRDGVINKKPPEGDYIKHWGEFVFLPGAVEAIALLTRRGYKIIVITNQAGIGRGRMTAGAVEEIHQNMTKELKKNGGRIKAIYVCPHPPEANCPCRKPKPGMLLQSAREHGIDLGTTFFLGDDEKDILAGRQAGCKTVRITEENSLLSAVQSLLS